MSNTIEKVLGAIRGKKTYIVCVLMALTSLVQVISGDMTIVQFLQDPNLLTALGIAALRNGVK